MTNAKKIRYAGYGCIVFSLLILLTLFAPLTEAAGLRETLLDEVGVQTGAARTKLLSLRNAAEIKKYTTNLRKLLMDMNAIERSEPRTRGYPRTVGTIERARFTVEKVIFESSHGILVPANVYVPKGIRGRVPAVLITEGHSAGGKSGYHSMCQGFCSQGYVVMTFDPMGQGERGVYYDRFSGNEHVAAGLQAYCADMHMSKLFIGDGMYAVDYLISRADVDPERICVTGSSGGGAQSLYLGALDERISVVIPSCFTTLDSMIVAGSATHPESNYFASFEQGITMESLCAMIIPRALLINASKEDYFPIEGTRVVYETAKEVFRNAGIPDNVLLFEGEGGHAYTKQKREEAYRFIARHFDTEAKPEPDVDPIPSKLLNCTETGNIENDGSKTLADLIRERAVSLATGRAERAAKTPRAEIKQRLARILGIKDFVYIPKGQVVSDNAGNAMRTIGLKYTASDGFELTGQVFIPENVRHEYLTVIVSPLSEFSSFQLALPFVGQNDIVFMTHPRGTIWAPYDKEGFYKIGVANKDYYFAMGAFNAGRTTSGIQTTDVLEGIRWVSKNIAENLPVRIVGDGVLAPASIYASVFHDGIEDLVIDHGLWGFEAIAVNRAYGYYLHPEVITVRGILEYFDLPELALLSGAKNISWTSPVDHNDAPLQEDSFVAFKSRVNRLAVIFGMKGKVRVDK